MTNPPLSPAAAPALVLPPRVVIFLTQEASADVPVGHSKLACLLPLGSASFVERLMDSCALAGVRQVDLVVSEEPEALRASLRDGEPWGIQLRWHHAKESTSPYTALRGVQLDAAQLTVVGHGHHWVSSRAVGELMKSSGIALESDADLRWSGWFSAPGDVVSALGSHVDYAALDSRLRRLAQVRCVMLAGPESARADCASDLLRAQSKALAGGQEAAIPPTWLQMPWGAVSPDAVVHPQARIQGPVLIGAGCVVEAGAELGPEVVLARDVYVTSGASIQQSLVLSNTYVGAQVALSNAVAQGHSIQSLKWDVRTVLRADDALMTPLKTGASLKTPLLSRLLALLAGVLLLPLVLPALLVQRLQTGQLLWQRSVVVKARAANSDALVWTSLRLPRGDLRVHRLPALFGALLDIVQGRRHWFGVRPRSESEWHALGRDWQNLFSGSAIGLLHAPAWRENSQSLNHEAYAAADAFMVVQKSTLTRLQMVGLRYR